VGPIAVDLPGSERFVERTLNAELINGVIWFVLKTVGVIFFILMPRGVFPRVRIDLLLQIGWYKLIGLAFVNIFIALGVLYSGILEPGVIF
jgi:NADH-quinone oxidoreductase subunit H